MNRLISLLFTFIALILVVLIIIPISTHYWISYSYVEGGDKTQLVSKGLWAECRLNGCVSFTEFDTSTLVKTVRGFLFLAMLSALLAVLFAGRQLAGKSDYSLLLRLSFIAIVFFVLIGMILYSAEFSSELSFVPDSAWGYSYIIGWVTFVLSLIAGIMVIFFTMERKKGSSEF